MSTWLSDEQQMIRDSAARFLGDHYGFAERQALVASDEGFSRDNWAQFAAMGWLGLFISERHGGHGGSTADQAALMEMLGTALVVEPVMATLLLGGMTLDIAGGHAAERLLPRVVAGDHLLALSHWEAARPHIGHVGTAAVRSDAGYRITGTKILVHHGGSADTLIVSAREAGSPTDRTGVTLFAIDRETDGVVIRGHRTVDGLRAAEVQFQDVPVPPNAIIGEPGGAVPVLEEVADRASVLLAAEAAGAMERTIELTVDYVKERKQFGRPLSSFQVLQHRMVDMYSQHRFARALIWRAARMLDGAEPAGCARAAAAVKTLTGKAGRFVGQEAIQLHGGMGMTADMAVGHYFKRLTMIDALFGNHRHHARRYAALERS